MKFLAPLRIAVARRSAPVAIRGYAKDPWASPVATESEASARADQAVDLKPPSKDLQDETVDAVLERSDSDEYEDALARELANRDNPRMTESQEDVFADNFTRNKHGKPTAELQRETVTYDWEIREKDKVHGKKNEKLLHGHEEFKSSNMTDSQANVFADKFAKTKGKPGKDLQDATLKWEDQRGEKKCESRGCRLQC